MKARFSVTGDELLSVKRQSRWPFVQTGVMTVVGELTTA